jgi:hypothetical protein
MASVAYRKLRRLAPRAKRVLARRGGEDPAIAAYGATLGPKADAYIAAYDAGARYEATWKKEMKEGRGAIQGLLKTVRAWVPLVMRDVKGFDGNGFADQPDVPDDVLSDAERLLSVIGEAGSSLNFFEPSQTAIEQSLQAAIKEWHEAEVADSSYQQLLAKVREAGATFDSELQLFRRTFGSIVGRSDKDFQKLRAERAATADEEDEPSAPPPAPVVAPAPPGKLEPES